MDTFGTRIRSAMTAAGISEVQLSDKSDISPGELYNYLTDAVKTADIGHIFSLAKVLNVNMEWLRTGREG